MKRSIIGFFVLLCCVSFCEAQQTASAERMRSVLRARAATLDWTVSGRSGSLVHVLCNRIATATPSGVCERVEHGTIKRMGLQEQTLTYRGITADGDAVVLTFDPAVGMYGTVLRNGMAYDISSATTTPALALRVPGKPLTVKQCETSVSDMSSAVLESIRRTLKTHDRLQRTDTITLDVAVECDGDFTVKLGGTDKARAYTTHLMAIASTVYEHELSVRLRVSYMRVWDPSTSPYDREQSVYGLLKEFSDLYESTQSGVQRHLAIAFTSRDEGGGVAKSIGGLCSKGASYCAVDLTGATSEYPTWSWDAQLVCHEMGHLFGGIHTQSCFWPGAPLDSCVASESGQCYSSDDVHASRGTIMSYCHMQLSSGGTSVLEFHPRQRSSVRAYIEHAACSADTKPDTSNALTCIVLDARTGEPLANVPLEIRSIDDELYVGMPKPRGDSALFTDANGRCTFRALGVGMYVVTAQKPYIRWPEPPDGYIDAYTVIVTSANDVLEMRLVKGVIVKLDVNDMTPSYSVQLNTFSSVPEVSLNVYSVIADQKNPTSAVLILPPGRHVIAPSALDVKFQPPLLELLLNDNDSLQTHTMKAVSATPGTTTIAIGQGIVHRSGNVRQSIEGSGAFQLRNADNGRIVAQGSMPSSGVLCVENIPSDTMYYCDVTADTTNYAPFYQEWPDIIPVYGVMSTLAVSKERRLPLIVRPLKFSVEQGTYKYLASPVILQGAGRTSPVSSTIEIPFSFRLADRTLKTFTIHRHGFLTSGGVKFPKWAYLPLTMLDDADLVLSPLGMMMLPDTNAPNPWQIGYSILGIEPNRQLVIEWQELGARVFDPETGVAKQSGRFTFQARLHEQGTIEYVYQRPVAITFPVNPQIGLRGADVLDHQVVNTRDGSMLNAVSGFVGSADHSLIIDQSTLMGTGLTYRWTPVAASVENERHINVHSPIVTSSSIIIPATTSTMRYSMFNVQGRCISTGHCSDGNTMIATENFIAGSYVLVVQGGVTPPVFSIVHICP